MTDLTQPTSGGSGAGRRPRLKQLLLDGHHAPAVDVAFDSVPGQAYTVAATVGRDRVMHLWTPSISTGKGRARKPVATRALLEHAEAIVSLGVRGELSGADS